MPTSADLTATNTVPAEEQIAHLAALNGWIETLDIHEWRCRYRRWTSIDMQVRVGFNQAGAISAAWWRNPVGEWAQVRFPLRHAVVRILIGTGAASA